MNKKDVVKTLETIAVYLELKGENPFKISAYRKAAKALEDDNRSLHQIEEPEKLPGIGKGTATVIKELVETGKSSLLEDLKREVPQGLIPLLKLPGLGGKKLARLYRDLGVVDKDTLKKACEEKRVQHLAGFGKKTEENILAALSGLGTRPERVPLADVLPIVAAIEHQLSAIADIECFSVAGSFRRLQETVKDLDFVIATNEPFAVSEQLTKLDHVTSVIAKGETKVSLEMEYECLISVDFRLVRPNEFASALHHFTGSKEHNVKIRQLAKKRGEKISEYGIEQENGKVFTFPSEEAFFNHFNLHYIPPELREGGEETERFKENVELVTLNDIQGDLHMHSTWSDGAHTIEEMADAAKERGYAYIAITDHSRYLKVANGLTPERIKQQREEIHRLNETYTDFTILSGTEMDILPDGTLDYDDELLAGCDFVIASIHSAFSQHKDKIMQRLVNALRNVHVDLIAHPTGRLIGRRSGYDVDLDMLIDVAKETNTALELNSNPNRLDLSPVWLEKAQKKGVSIIINTDAHHRQMLSQMEIGVKTARKGWIKKETVLNTRTLDEFRQFLNRHD